MPPAKILIAAKSPLFGRSLANMVAHVHHEVMQSNNAEEVIDWVAKGKVDLCFVQDMLSDISGLECCAQLMRDTQEIHIPVIVFSRNAALENAALESGASGFLRIPCQGSAILGLVERWNKIALQSPVASIVTASPAQVPSLEIDRDTKKELQVLLVDDSKLIHTYVRNVLEKTPYGFLQAYDGVEGFDMACLHVPDLIISDIDMPNMNGFEMCKKIKENIETENIPILVLSARGTGVDIDRGFDVGANDYLTKPVDENELLTRVEMMLNKEENGKREKVLVVEDSRVQRNLIVQSLELQGFEVASAEDGQAGLKKAVEWLPDLVITDSEMPVMNGRDLTRAMKSREDLEEVPVLMLTAADSLLDRAKGRHAGVSAYLTKPFVPDKVVVIAEKLIAERRLIRERQAMHLYLSDAAAEAAAKAADSIGGVNEAMRAESRWATIFFADIVDFTAITERMPPTDLVAMLNEYFDVMAPLFRQNGGGIDKFVGDAIMAVFTSENEERRAEASYNAVKTGIQMLENLNIYNAGREETIAVRVGINSGEVIMGDIGSKLYHRDYTVIGDSVNIAARLESSATNGTMQISDSTYCLIRDRIAVNEIGGIMVKGKSEPIITYEVLGLLE
jgi:DNA-binding response OmpR family regulator